MTRTLALMACAVLLTAITTTARGDDVLFGFEGDTLPGTASDWVIANACELDCSRRLENGHFLLEWGIMGDLVNYDHTIADPGGASPPPSLWVEWQFRSNQALPPTSASCDAQLVVRYKNSMDAVWMFQDAVFDFLTGNFILGLEPGIFHTYRFESLDGQNYTMAVDGVVFKSGLDTDGNPAVAFIQFGGEGGCSVAPERPVPVRNEWDFIRYGTLASGELIVSTDPPAGSLTNEQAAGVSTILVTYAGPNYTYVDDISVSVTSGIASKVIGTRRLDNGSPNVLEVVLDGPLPSDALTTLTFTDGAGSQTIQYAVGAAVPASSTWGLVTLALGMLIAGVVMLRRRLIC